MDHEQDRVVSIFAANPDPLVDTSDPYEPLVGYTVGAANSQHPGDAPLAHLPMNQHTDQRNRCGAGRYRQDGFNHRDRSVT
jgi:hypothetical protein